MLWGLSLLHLHSVRLPDRSHTNIRPLPSTRLWPQSFLCRLLLGDRLRSLLLLYCMSRCGLLYRRNWLLRSLRRLLNRPSNTWFLFWITHVIIRRRLLAIRNNYLFVIIIDRLSACRRKCRDLIFLYRLLLLFHNSYRLNRWHNHLHMLRRCHSLWQSLLWALLLWMLKFRILFLLNNWLTILATFNWLLFLFYFFLF
jgi:hypothetical protein